MSETLPHYTIMRKRLFFPDGEDICIGEEGSYYSDSVIYLKYDELIRSNYKPSSLRVIKEKGQIADISELIERFPTVKKLHVSRDLIPFKKTSLDNLTSFALQGYCDEDTGEKAQDSFWREDQVLPNVKAFRYFDPHSYDLCGLRSHNMPNLEWLECDLDKKGAVLDIIKEFDNLKALDLDLVWNHDVFGAMDNRLKVLRLGGFTKGFLLEGIAEQTNLEILYINGYMAEFNLQWLKDTNLKEVILLNCPKIVNAEVLLEMKHLESLEIINCKKALPKELKARLKEREFYHLNIDWT